MEISAVWLQTRKNKIVLMVEWKGQWYEVIDELLGDRESTISHCAHLDNINWLNLKPVNFEPKQAK